MTQEEINKQTLGFIRQVMADNNSTQLVVAILVDTKTATYKQVVGVGVNLEILKDAMDTSFEMLKYEHSKRMNKNNAS